MADNAKKALAERRAELDKANAEAQRQMDEARPTPTQEEIDLARVSASGETLADEADEPAPDEKKPAKSSRATDADGASAPYKTRDSKAD